MYRSNNIRTLYILSVTIVYAGSIIEGLSDVTYLPGLTPLPIELTCNVTGVVTAWRVNGTSYTRNQLTNGSLSGHNRTGANILVNIPVNNTQYFCVFLDDNTNEGNSDPAYIIIAGKYDKYLFTCIHRITKYNQLRTCLLRAFINQRSI